MQSNNHELVAEPKIDFIPSRVAMRKLRNGECGRHHLSSFRGFEIRGSGKEIGRNWFVFSTLSTFMLTQLGALHVTNG